MAIDFVNIFSDLESMGFFDVVLPFLLVFTICFAVFAKTKILGEKKNIHVILSLVIAILSIRSAYFVELMKNFLPNIAMFMVVILMFLLMLGIFAGENRNWTGMFWGIGAIVSLVFVLFSLLFDTTQNYIQFPNWLNDLAYSIDDRTKGIILFLGILVLVLWLIVREPRQPGDESLLTKLMKGPQ